MSESTLPKSALNASFMYSGWPEPSKLAGGFISFPAAPDPFASTSSKANMSLERSVLWPVRASDFIPCAPGTSEPRLRVPQSLFAGPDGAQDSVPILRRELHIAQIHEQDDARHKRRHGAHGPAVWPVRTLYVDQYGKLVGSLYAGVGRLAGPPSGIGLDRVWLCQGELR